MVNKKMRCIAALTVVVFGSTSIANAQPSLTYLLKVPKNHGTVRERWVPPTSQQREGEEPLHDKIVVLIEDAHASREAQERIASLVDDIHSQVSKKTDQNNVMILGLEGATGELRAPHITTFPDETVKKDVLHSYLLNGKLSGAEYAALSSNKNIQLFGIEDANLYCSNVESYTQSQAEREKALRRIETLARRLSLEKKKTFNQKLLSFDTTALLCEAGDIPLDEYVKEILVAQSALSLSTDGYTNLMMLSNNPDSSIQHNLINGADLLAECRSMAISIRIALAQTEREKRLIQAEAGLRVVKSLVSLTALTSDLDYYRAHADECSSAYLTSVLVPSATTDFTCIDTALKYANTYYELADERNKAFVDRTIEALTGSARSLATIVAGGYHTKGVTELLRERGISYAVVTPTLSNASIDMPYEDLMMQKKSPYESLIESSLSTLQVPRNAWLLTRDVNEGLERSKLFQTQLAADLFAGAAVNDIETHGVASLSNAALKKRLADAGWEHEFPLDLERIVAIGEKVGFVTLAINDQGRIYKRFKPLSGSVTMLQDDKKEIVRAVREMFEKNALAEGTAVASRETESFIADLKKMEQGEDHAGLDLYVRTLLKELPTIGPLELTISDETREVAKKYIFNRTDPEINAFVERCQEYVDHHQDLFDMHGNHINALMHNMRALADAVAVPWIEEQLQKENLFTEEAYLDQVEKAKIGFYYFLANRSGAEGLHDSSLKMQLIDAFVHYLIANKTDKKAKPTTSVTYAQLDTHDADQSSTSHLAPRTQRAYLDTDGTVTIDEALRGTPEEMRAIAHEYQGHGNIAYLKKTNPQLWQKIVSVIFDGTTVDERWEMLGQLLENRGQRVEDRPEVETDSSQPQAPSSKLVAQLSDLETLLAHSKEFGLTNAKGEVVGYDRSKVAEELMAIWAEGNAAIPIHRCVAQLFAQYKKYSGEDVLEKAGFYDSMEEVLKKDASGFSRRYVCWLMDSKDSYEEAAETRRKADEKRIKEAKEKKEKERLEKERKEREEEEKKRVKKITEKLNKISKDLKTKVYSVEEMSGLQNESIDHEIAVTVNRRLLQLARSGKLKDLAFHTIDDLVTALINGVDKNGTVFETDDNGIFDPEDRDTLNMWLTEMGMNELVADVRDSLTYTHTGEPDAAEERAREHIHDALTGAHTHDHHHDGLSGFAEEIGLDPHVLTNTVKSILLFCTLIAAKYIALYFNLDIETTCALAAIVGAGALGNGAAQSNGFPQATEEQLNTPEDWIKKYTTNITKQMDEITVESLYLDKKMEELSQILSQGSRNNAVLVGEHECTTGLMRNIAYAITKAQKDDTNELMPKAFQDAEIIQLNIAAMLGHLNKPMGYETRMRDLAREIIKAANESQKKYIFYFDFEKIAWIHDKRREQIAEIPLLFKTLLEESTVPVIGIASEAYYKRFFVDRSENKGLQKNFSKISLDKLQMDDLQDLLHRHLERVPFMYKKQMMPGMRVTMNFDKTLKDVVDHMQDLFDESSIPVVLLELLDEVITRKLYTKNNTALLKRNAYDTMQRLWEEVKQSEQEKNTALTEFLYQSLKTAQAEWESLNALTDESSDRMELTFDDFAERIAARKGISVEQLVQDKNDKLDGLVAALKSRVIGQDEVGDEIYKAFKRRKNGDSDKARPFGAFLLNGPTGVGKTEITRALADYYYDGEVIRLDMSEYMDKNAVWKLRGAAPGFVGFEQGGALTKAVERKPYSVILLDEIDKASPEVFGVLNEILGEGTCTDGAGKKINFRNTIIIMTANAGMKDPETRKMVQVLADLREAMDTYERNSHSERSEESTVRDSSPQAQNDGLHNYIQDCTSILNTDEHVRALVQSALTELEFCKELNTSPQSIIEGIEKTLRNTLDQRLTGAIHSVFGARQDIVGRLLPLGGIYNCNALTHSDLNKILDIRLKELNTWLKPYAIELTFSPEMREFLIQEGYDPEMGARPLARAIKRYVTAPLADAILANTITKGQSISAQVTDGRTTFTVLDKASMHTDVSTVMISDETKEDVRKKTETILAEKPREIEQKGIALLEKDTLGVEIPFDKDAIKKELAPISKKTGAPVEQLLQEVEQQNNEAMRWVNDAFDNLSLKAKEDDLPDAFANPHTLTEVVNVLHQRHRNNVFLVGGDTRLRDSMIDYIASATMKGQIAGFENVRMLRLTLNEVIEYMQGIGTLEECMRRFLKNIEEDDKAKGLKTYIHIDYDELQKTVARYRPSLRTAENEQEESFNLGFFMIPFEESSVRLIMSSQNRRVGDIDAVRRNFSTVSLDAMSKNDTIETFWLYVKNRLEKKNNGDGPRKIDFAFSSLQTVLDRFQKYLQGEPLMETLLDFMNFIFPKKGESEAKRERQYNAKLKGVMSRLGFLSQNGKRDSAHMAADEKMRKAVSAVVLHQKADGTSEEWEITDRDAITYLTEKRGVALNQIDADEWEKVRNLEKTLLGKVLYQESHIKKIVRAVKGGLLGLKDPRRPVATIMLNGPTGNGKTATAEALSEALGWGPIIKRNLSTIKSVADLNTLIGSPPGYVGHGEHVENYLTTEVINKPKSVIVFDEVDKALRESVWLEGKSILDVLLPIFEDGRLTDSIGQTADFSQCIIVMCSNGGIEEVYNPETRSFIRDKGLYKAIGELVTVERTPEHMQATYEKVCNEIDTRVNDYCTQIMRPEMRNRIDEMLTFGPLTKEALLSIVKQKMLLHNARMKTEYGSTILFEDDRVADALALDIICSEFKPEFGARSLEKPLLELYVDPLSAYIRQSGIERTVTVSFHDGKISLTAKEEAAQHPLAKLSEEERYIFSKIETGLAEKRKGENLVLDEVTEWCDLKHRDIARDSNAKVPFTGNATVLASTTNDFFSRGYQDTLIPGTVAKKIDEWMEGAEDATPSATIATAVNAVIEMGKRMNLEQAIADNAQPLNNDLAVTVSKKLRKIYSPYVEQANAKYAVSLLHEVVGNMVSIGVRFNSGLSRIVHRLVFEKEWTSEEEITVYCQENGLDALIALCVSLYTLKQRGVIPFYANGNETVVWFAMPQKSVQNNKEVALDATVLLKAKKIRNAVLQMAGMVQKDSKKPVLPVGAIDNTQVQSVAVRSMQETVDAILMAADNVSIPNGMGETVNVRISKETAEMYKILFLQAQRNFLFKQITEGMSRESLCERGNVLVHPTSEQLYVVLGKATYRDGDAVLGVYGVGNTIRVAAIPLQNITNGGWNYLSRDEYMKRAAETPAEVLGALSDTNREVEPSGGFRKGMPVYTLRDVALTLLNSSDYVVPNMNTIQERNEHNVINMQRWNILQQTVTPEMLISIQNEDDLPLLGGSVIFNTKEKRAGVVKCAVMAPGLVVEYPNSSDIKPNTKIHIQIIPLATLLDGTWKVVSREELTKERELCSLIDVAHQFLIPQDIPFNLQEEILVMHSIEKGEQLWDMLTRGVPLEAYVSLTSEAKKELAPEKTEGMVLYNTKEKKWYVVQQGSGINFNGNSTSKLAYPAAFVGGDIDAFNVRSVQCGELYNGDWLHLPSEESRKRRSLPSPEDTKKAALERLQRDEAFLNDLTYEKLVPYMMPQVVVFVEKLKEAWAVFKLNESNASLQKVSYLEFKIGESPRLFYTKESTTPLDTLDEEMKEVNEIFQAMMKDFVSKKLLPGDEFIVQGFNNENAVKVALIEAALKYTEVSQSPQINAMLSYFKKRNIGIECTQWTDQQEIWKVSSLDLEFKYDKKKRELKVSILRDKPLLGGSMKITNVEDMVGFDITAANQFVVVLKGGYNNNSKNVTLFLTNLLLVMSRKWAIQRDVIPDDGEVYSRICEGLSQLTAQKKRVLIGYDDAVTREIEKDLLIPGNSIQSMNKKVAVSQMFETDEKKDIEWRITVHVEADSTDIRRLLIDELPEGMWQVIFGRNRPREEVAAVFDAVLKDGGSAPQVVALPAKKIEWPDTYEALKTVVTEKYLTSLIAAVKQWDSSNLTFPTCLEYNPKMDDAAHKIFTQMADDGLISKRERLMTGGWRIESDASSILEMVMRHRKVSEHEQVNQLLRVLSAGKKENILCSVWSYTAFQEEQWNVPSAGISITYNKKTKKIKLSPHKGIMKPLYATVLANDITEVISDGDTPVIVMKGGYDGKGMKEKVLLFGKVKVLSWQEASARKLMPDDSEIYIRIRKALIEKMDDKSEVVIGCDENAPVYQGLPLAPEISLLSKNMRIALKQYETYMFVKQWHIIVNSEADSRDICAFLVDELSDDVWKKMFGDTPRLDIAAIFDEALGGDMQKERGTPDVVKPEMGVDVECAKIKELLESLTQKGLTKDEMNGPRAEYRISVELNTGLEGEYQKLFSAISGPPNNFDEPFDQYQWEFIINPKLVDNPDRTLRSIVQDLMEVTMFKMTQSDSMKDKLTRFVERSENKAQYPLVRAYLGLEKSTETKKTSQEIVWPETYEELKAVVTNKYLNNLRKEFTGLNPLTNDSLLLKYMNVPTGGALKIFQEMVEVGLLSEEDELIVKYGAADKAIEQILDMVMEHMGVSKDVRMNELLNVLSQGKKDTIECQFWSSSKKKETWHDMKRNLKLTYAQESKILEIVPMKASKEQTAYTMRMANIVAIREQDPNVVIVRKGGYDENGTTEKSLFGSNILIMSRAEALRCGLIVDTETPIYALMEKALSALLKSLYTITIIPEDPENGFLYYSNPDEEFIEGDGGRVQLFAISSEIATEWRFKVPVEADSQDVEDFMMSMLDDQQWKRIFGDVSREKIAGILTMVRTIARGEKAKVIQPLLDRDVENALSALVVPRSTVSLDYATYDSLVNVISCEYIPRIFPKEGVGYMPNEVGDMCVTYTLDGIRGLYAVFQDMEKERMLSDDDVDTLSEKCTQTAMIQVEELKQEITAMSMRHQKISQSAMLNDCLAMAMCSGIPVECIVWTQDHEIWKLPNNLLQIDYDKRKEKLSVSRLESLTVLKETIEIKDPQDIMMMALSEGNMLTIVKKYGLGEDYCKYAHEVTCGEERAVRYITITKAYAEGLLINATETNEEAKAKEASSDPLDIKTAVEPKTNERSVVEALEFETKDLKISFKENERYEFAFKELASDQVKALPFQKVVFVMEHARGLVEERQGTKTLELNMAQYEGYQYDEIAGKITFIVTDKNALLSRALLPSGSGIIFVAPSLPIEGRLPIDATAGRVTVVASDSRDSKESKIPGNICELESDLNELVAKFLIEDVANEPEGEVKEPFVRQQGATMWNQIERIMIVIDNAGVIDARDRDYRAIKRGDVLYALENDGTMDLMIVQGTTPDKMILSSRVATGEGQPFAQKIEHIGFDQFVTCNPPVKIYRRAVDDDQTEPREENLTGITAQGDDAALLQEIQFFFNENKVYKVGNETVIVSPHVQVRIESIEEGYRVVGESQMKKVDKTFDVASLPDLVVAIENMLEGEFSVERINSQLASTFRGSIIKIEQYFTTRMRCRQLMDNLQAQGWRRRGEIEKEGMWWFENENQGFVLVYDPASNECIVAFNKPDGTVQKGLKVIRELLKIERGPIIGGMQEIECQDALTVAMVPELNVLAIVFDDTTFNERYGKEKGKFNKVVYTNDKGSTCMVIPESEAQAFGMLMPSKTETVNGQTLREQRILITMEVTQFFRKYYDEVKAKSSDQIIGYRMDDAREASFHVRCRELCGVAVYDELKIASLCSRRKDLSPDTYRGLIKNVAEKVLQSKQAEQTQGPASKVRRGDMPVPHFVAQYVLDHFLADHTNKEKIEIRGTESDSIRMIHCAERVECVLLRNVRGSLVRYVCTFEPRRMSWDFSVYKGAHRLYTSDVFSIVDDNGVSYMMEPACSSLISLDSHDLINTPLMRNNITQELIIHETVEFLLRQYVPYEEWQGCLPNYEAWRRFVDEFETRIKPSALYKAVCHQFDPERIQAFLQQQGPRLHGGSFHAISEVFEQAYTIVSEVEDDSAHALSLDDAYRMIKQGIEKGGLGYVSQLCSTSHLDDFLHKAVPLRKKYVLVNGTVLLHDANLQNGSLAYRDGDSPVVTAVNAMLYEQIKRVKEARSVLNDTDLEIIVFLTEGTGPITGLAMGEQRELLKTYLQAMNGKGVGTDVVALIGESHFVVGSAMKDIVHQLVIQKKIPMQDIIGVINDRRIKYQAIKDYCIDNHIQYAALDPNVRGVFQQTSDETKFIRFPGFSDAVNAFYEIPSKSFSPVIDLSQTTVYVPRDMVQHINEYIHAVETHNKAIKSAA